MRSVDYFRSKRYIRYETPYIRYIFVNTLNRTHLPYTSSIMKEGTYEVEVKALLGSEEAAVHLKEQLFAHDPSCSLIASSNQLNHYFEGGDPKALVVRVSSKLPPEVAKQMEEMAEKGTSISVRTREANGSVLIVMKASIGQDSSENGVMRMEVEQSVSPLSLAELDAEVLSAGYQYQAKWSRSREEYKTGDISVCLDKNAGYGYLAEFEKVVFSQEEAKLAHQDITSLMHELMVAELPQDRLERMFAHYNEHWPEYYGTDKIFTLD